ncbi:MAG: ABC transporter permease [Erysipelotrichaceae bacterium]|nr:ABC transporter permease [Erysipelotrichaceae bacterium]
MENKKFDSIPKEKFTLVHHGERISDKKFDDKPIGYFKDALIRFKKNKASVLAFWIILGILAFSILAPVLITNHDSKFMCNMYAKKPARIASMLNVKIFDGGMDTKSNETGFIKLVGIGMAAADGDGQGVTVSEGLASEYSPMIEIGEAYEQEISKTRSTTYYPFRVDAYLREGFVYRSVEQSEYARIKAWEEETGLQVLYPVIDNNEWTIDPEDANYWYKTNSKGQPVKVNAAGDATVITYSENMVLEDNYKRDAEGNVMYYTYAGGGNADTAQYRVRLLYYNYYQYLYGSTPDYVMGTDSQGYDLALRIAGGIKLSMTIAISVSIINFIIGAMWGAVAGYYGGTVDILMERITDILAGVPFIVVATLFQIHLAAKVGPIVCLLFAYILTGWIGTSSRVRTQFYRFKNQEYVMAARTLGAKDKRIIWKHIFPNTLGTIITSVALVIPSTILSESNLSFLGIIKLGTADYSSLGNLLAEANGIWTNYPHLMIYPALFISLLMITFNLFGNGLRDAFNPSLRGTED